MGAMNMGHWIQKIKTWITKKIDVSGGCLSQETGAQAGLKGGTAKR